MVNVRALILTRVSTSSVWPPLGPSVFVFFPEGVFFKPVRVLQRHFRALSVRHTIGKMSDVDQDFAVRGVRVPVCVFLLEMRTCDFARSAAS